MLSRRLLRKANSNLRSDVNCSGRNKQLNGELYNARCQYREWMN